MEKTERFNLNEMTLKEQQDKNDRINQLKSAVNENISQVPNVKRHYKFVLIYEASGMIDYSHLIGDISEEERSALKGGICKVLKDVLETKKDNTLGKVGVANV